MAHAAPATQPATAVLEDHLHVAFASSAAAAGGLVEDAAAAACAAFRRNVELYDGVVRAHAAGPHLVFDVVVDGGTRQQSVPKGYFDAFLWPLAVYLFTRAAAATAARGGNRRCLVGISGAAGSGKSVTCAVLVAVINGLSDRASAGDGAGADGASGASGGGGSAAARGHQFCTTVSMDGYHFPNAYLLSQPLDPAHGGSAGGATEKVAGQQQQQQQHAALLPSQTLKAIKGRPPTIDGCSLAADLRRLAARASLPVSPWSACGGPSVAAGTRAR